MKNKINFLWNTALSMLDIGSSLIYNLLGRNLDATDIELIEKIFTHMSTVKSIETEDDDDDDDKNNNILNLIEFEQIKSRRLLSLIERLNKGKDILLITNNGYNLLQISVLNMLSCTFNLIEFELDLNEIPFVSLFNARLNIIRSLLEYGCDPNRGIGFLNDKKFKHSENINNNSNNNYYSDYDDISDTETVVNKIHNDSNHHHHQHHHHHHYQQQSKLAITPIDTPLLLFVCLYNCHNLLDYSSITSNNNNNNTENEQNSLINSSSSSIATSISTDYDKLNKRRHTIQALHISSSKIHSMAYKKQGSSSINIKSTIGDKSDSDNWPSRSIDKYSSSSSSIDDRDLDNDELSLHDDEDVESISSSCSSYSSGCYQDLKITNNTSNLITSPNKTFDSNRNYASSEMSDYSEEEDDDDDDNSFNDECNKTDHENKPNIYNYDFEVDDQNYFDKYDIDIDSKCCKLFNNDFETIAGSTMTHQQFGMEHFENDLINQKMSSLSTSIFSIPSSSIQTINMTSSLIATNPITTTTTSSDLNKLTELARTNYKKRYIYEQLNKQRLNLLDLLLEHGADKYLVGSISKSNISQMNKKTYNMLSKWFSQTTNNGQHSLRSMSPIIASICLDDVEVFSRLYSHHQMLFNYFKPNEDYELIYYAIRFQSKKCLIYLLSYLNTKDEITTSSSSSSSSFKLRNSVSLPTSLSKQCSIHNQFDTINKNINTMFYILENTRSSKIISVLLKCGFDLTKRDPTTGNTVLHCLFHSAKLTTSTNQSILKEFNTPRSLSKILFKLLKNGGLKAFVNTPNYAHKVCMQSLFEWNELINTCFFQSTSNEFKWKYELEECVRLLLKSGADMFTTTTTTSDETNEINCILNLIETIHKNSLDRPCYQNEFYHHDSTTKSSNNETNISQILNNSTSKSSQLFAKAKKMLNTTTTNNSRSNNSKNNIETETNKSNKFNVKRQCQLNKRLDIKYLFNLLNNVIDLPNMISNLNRKKYKFYHQNDSFNNNNNQSSNFNYIPGESIISKYLEIIQNVNLDEFETAFKLFKLLCKLEKQLVKKRVLNYVSPQVIKTLINNWILDPNLFSSNRQLDKNHFVKSIIIHLIANDMFDPNDSSTVYNSDHCLVSNNLLKHCVRLIFKSKTGYQLELIYDLMRTLIQYGANPNLEPYELVEKNFFSLRFEDCNNNKSMSVLSQLCDCSHHNNVATCQSPFNFKQKDNHLNSLSHINEHHYHHNNHNHYHHHHHHHHHHHKNRHNYFNDYFNNKYYSHTRQERHELSHSNLMYSSLNPILLLTPSPSYDSLISLPSSQSNNCTYATTMSNNNNNNNNNNIIIDKSILFLNHYKKFVKLLYDSMDNNTIKQCLKHKKNHYKHYYIRNYSVDTVEKQDGDHLAALKLYSVESLDMYLEKLASTPRTLKSIVRRHVLNQLIQNQKMNKSTEKLTAIAKQVEQLPLPRRIMDYLLFIE